MDVLLCHIQGGLIHGADMEPASARDDVILRYDLEKPRNFKCQAPLRDSDIVVQFAHSVGMASN